MLYPQVSATRTTSLTDRSMVKVPVNTRHSPNSLPYPVTPTSPLSSSQNTVLRTRGSEPSKETMEPERGSSVSAVSVPDHRGDTRGDNRRELPTALQVGQSSADAWANDGRRSLGVPPSDLTPRSSSESQRSQDCIYGSPKVPHLPSTNPYLRTKHDSLDTSRLAATGNQSSTAVWADQSEKLPGNPSSDRDQCRSCS